MNSCLYRARVLHARTRPKRYRFTANLFQFYLDLDELDGVAARLHTVTHNRPGLYSFRDSDHLFLGAEDTRSNLAAYLSREGIEGTLSQVALLTNLRVCGHVFNPVSFYFCQMREPERRIAVAEVHNTYGELKPFLLTDWREGAFRDSHAKDFYISPFSDLATRLHFRVGWPGEELALDISESQSGRSFFFSRLEGERKPLSDAALLAESVRFPFITLKVITLIHWHALRLYAKGLRPRGKKATAHQQTGVLPKAPSARRP